jgi:hypothetical protein
MTEFAAAHDVDFRHILCGQKLQEPRYRFSFFRNSKVLKISFYSETKEMLTKPGEIRRWRG